MLSGVLAPVDESALIGIGTVLRGDLVGNCDSLGARWRTRAMDMLLDIPTGLHFIEVRVQGVRSCLLSTVSSATSPGPAGSSM